VGNDAIAEGNEVPSTALLRVSVVKIFLIRAHPR